MKKERVALLLSSVALYDYENGYEMGIAKNLVEENYKVIVKYCWKSVSSCAGNPLRRPLVCIQCKLNRTALILENSKITFKPFKKLSGKIVQSIKDWVRDSETNSEEDLKNLVYKNYDVGLSILSYCYSRSKSDSSDFQKQFTKIELKKLILNALVFYELALSEISNLRPDLVVFGNGRCIEQRAFLRASEFTKNEFFAIEGGYKPHIKLKDREYTFIKNGGIHDLKMWEAEIMDYWDKSKNLDRRAISENWFKQRKNRDSSLVYNDFVLTTQEGFLGEINSIDKPMVSIFTSTWAERAAVGIQWASVHGKNQYEILDNLLKSVFELSDNYSFILRMHPNQRTVPKEVEKIKSLASKYEFLQIVDPESRYDSYAIVDKSHVVITLGSTIGLEASYWGKPVICLCPTDYQFLNIASFPKDLREVSRLIQNPVLGSRDDAIISGFFKAHWGKGLVKLSKIGPFLNLSRLKFFVKNFLLLKNFRTYAVGLIWACPFGSI